MRPLCYALIVALVHASCASSIFAQGQQYDLPPGGAPQERATPGAHTPYGDLMDRSIIGAKPGSLRPRVPVRTHPRGPAHVAPNIQPAPAQLMPEPIAAPNSWSVLFEVEDEGSPQGLALDQAIERLVRASIALRARSLEIPQAQADVLTAGMHANPIVYFDKQLIPYRPYNAVTNPGGPAQYDLNVAYPIDVSGKRSARVEVASSASRVVEALYQDAVRQEVDRLSDAYVNALAARLTLRSIKSGLARMDEIRKLADAHPGDPRDAAALRRQIQIQRQTLELALIDAESSWRNSKRTLSTMLNLTAEEAARLDLRGAIKDTAPMPPQLDQLVAMATGARPDLAAYRLGVARAQADVRLSQANRLPDVFALYQPFTYQDNSPFNAPSSTSWALGATVTVPLFDRNQGNIRRSQINVDQSHLELQVVEKRVASEVAGVYEEYMATRRALDHIERDMLPEIEKAHSESLHRFRDGSLDAGTYFSVRRDLDDLGRQYRDLLVRHRRSMLDINTAVGLRVLP
jgi:outer membrane protein, heavy metal efflux system